MRGTERSQVAQKVIVHHESKTQNNKKADMSLVHNYERVMVCSAGWLGPLTSPAAGLAAKILGLIWVFQMQG